MPKQCLPLEAQGNGDTIKMAVNINLQNNDGTIYEGLCYFKILDPYDSGDIERMITPSPILDANNIEQMPIILSDPNSLMFNESQVWIDPTRSPFVYNHYNLEPEQLTYCKNNIQSDINKIAQNDFTNYSAQNNVLNYNTHANVINYNAQNNVINYNAQNNVINYNTQNNIINHITLEQHNTYVTQNIYTSNHKDQVPQRRRTRKETQKPIYDEDQFDIDLAEALSQSEGYQTNVPKTQNNYTENENNALEQLMNTDCKKKQRKTILFLGHNSNSGQTMQIISYNDPLVKCAETNKAITVGSSGKKSSKKTYQCDKCKQIFHSISEFRQHMIGNTTNQTSKSKPDGFLCMECGRNLKTESKFVRHVSGHGNPELECPKCHKVYATKATLKAHQKLHNRKHACKFCTRTFDKVDALNVHIKKVHLLYICNTNECEFMTENAAEYKAHTEKHQLEIHQDNFNLEECYDEIEVITENDLKSENMVDGPDSDPCIFSNKFFFEVDDLNQDVTEEVLESDDINVQDENNNHSMKSNVNSALFEAGMVSARTSGRDAIKQADSVLSKVMLNNVFSMKSGKNSRYNKTCQVCFKNFDRSADLKRHLIEHIIHVTLMKSAGNQKKTGAFKLVCEICNIKSFTEISKLKDHLREHANLTLYKCTFCDKSFSDSSNFSKHKKLHGNAHFQCDYCQRKFNSKKMLTSHIDYHMKNDPVKCNFCPKKFHFNSMLNKHMKTKHSGSSKIKHPCKFCDESFYSLKDKWDHQWDIHKVRKTVIDCLQCDSKFRKYSELKRHCLDEHDVNIPKSKYLRKRHL